MTVEDLGVSALLLLGILATIGGLFLNSCAGRWRPIVGLLALMAAGALTALLHPLLWPLAAMFPVMYVLLTRDPHDVPPSSAPRAHPAHRQPAGG